MTRKSLWRQNSMPCTSLLPCSHQYPYASTIQQRAALQAAVHCYWRAPWHPPSPFFERSSSCGFWYTTARHVHLWTGRGRQKLLMDLFYASVTVPDDDSCCHNNSHKHTKITKRRVHFHEFMLDVHHRIFIYKQKHPRGDALPIIAQQLAQEAQLLCFDEFPSDRHCRCHDFEATVFTIIGLECRDGGHLESSPRCLV